MRSRLIRMRASPPLSPEILDEDLQIILATLATLRPQAERLAPASSRALEEALIQVEQARQLLDQAQHDSDDARQLSFSLIDSPN